MSSFLRVQLTEPPVLQVANCQLVDERFELWRSDKVLDEFADDQTMLVNDVGPLPKEIKRFLTPNSEIVNSLGLSFGNGPLL